MDYSLLQNPLTPFVILVVLSLGDLVLERIAARQYDRYTSGFITYEAALSNQYVARPRPDIVRVITKLLPAVAILLIWLIVESAGFRAALRLYWAILGFALAIFLVIDLRHVESILIGRLAKNYGDRLSGKLTVKRMFSRRQSAVQLSTVFVILLLVFLLVWEPFFLGAALAPLSLVIRNLARAKS